MTNSSPPANRRVVITGAGVVCPIGIGVNEYWQALLAQRSGVTTVPALADTPFPVRFGGHIADFDAKQYVKPRKSLKVMSREIQTGFAAAELAIEHAALDKQAVDADRFGVVYGCEMLYCDIDELADVYRNCMPQGHFDFSRWGERSMSDMFPLWMLKYLPNMVACHIGIAHDARGPNNTITLGDASSLMAVIEASRVIERGQADVMLAGGAGSRLSLTPMMYLGDLRLSHHSADPAAACRPFDARRDGMVRGEGAGALVLESAAHAQARKARVLAELVGSGLAYEIQTDRRPPTGMAIQHAIARALQEADVVVDAIDHVNAHGLSTVEDDAREAGAIERILGPVPVTAPKSYFGSLGAGTGAVEMAASLLAFEHGQVPVTLNYQQPDPRCPLQVIHDEPKPLEKEAALILNHSTTGQVAAVVIRRTR